MLAKLNQVFLMLLLDFLIQVFKAGNLGHNYKLKIKPQNADK